VISRPRTPLRERGSAGERKDDVGGSAALVDHVSDEVKGQAQRIRRWPDVEFHGASEVEAVDHEFGYPNREVLTEPAPTEGCTELGVTASASATRS
jgi:hypothetical protein